MRKERCPTCGRTMFVKHGVGAEVLHLAAVVGLLVVLWLVCTHSADLVAVGKAVLR